MTTAAAIFRDPISAYPAATVACFDPTKGELPRRGLDEQRTIEYLERLAAAGAPAVLIAASTGHGHVRTVDELQQWFETAARANLGRCIRMALLRPEDGMADNERLLACLSEHGYPIVFVRPGTDLPTDATDELIAENMRPTVEQAAQRGLAIGVYSIPDVSGRPLSADAAAVLATGPGGDRIVAVKVTEANYDNSTRRFLEHPQLKHLKIVQGWDPHLARALQDDSRRCGVTSGPMSFAVYQYLHVLQAAGNKDWQEVAAAQSAVTALFESMQDDLTKFADLQRAKYIMGLGHPLTSTVSQEQVDRVLKALENLPRQDDRSRLSRSLALMGEGPCMDRLKVLSRG